MIVLLAETLGLYSLLPVACWVERRKWSAWYEACNNGVPWICMYGSSEEMFEIVQGWRWLISFVIGLDSTYTSEILPRLHGIKLEFVCRWSWKQLGSLSGSTRAQEIHVWSSRNVVKVPKMKIDEYLLLSNDVQKLQHQSLGKLFRCTKGWNVKQPAWCRYSRSVCDRASVSSLCSRSEVTFLLLSSW